MPKLNTTTSGIITATLTADSSPTLELQQNGVAIRTLGESQLVMGTAQSTATGAVAYDFTGIPSWAKRITVMFNGVSTNGTSNLQIQIGSGSVTTTGYNSICTRTAGTALQTSAITSGFLVNIANANNALFGAYVITFVSGFTYVEQGNSSDQTNIANYISAGGVTLSGTLDRVRITTVNGTDAFDAGTVNIMWE